MIELDHLNIELSGMNLIEASAGTGKTYAIACLYLRLIIELNLTPEQILVVTYTEAATKELRGRIRSRIKEALEVFEGDETADPFLLGIRAKKFKIDEHDVQNYSSDSNYLIRARERLDRALRSFDTASIFTIHGFCQRALQDNAFESCSLHDTKLVTDQGKLLQEIVDDFWRKCFFNDNAPLLSHTFLRKYSPDYFFKFLHGMLGNPDLKIIPKFSHEEINEIKNKCMTGFMKLQDEWDKTGAIIREILTSHKGLSRSKDNYREDVVQGLIKNMLDFLSGDNPFEIFESFEKFCTDRIEKQRLKKNPPPQHVFFDQCENHLKTVDELFLALLWELVVFCRKELPGRKIKKNIRFFDDLLNDLHKALYREKNETFAVILREKFRAALIDEFQDTDPVQYDIFRKIYAGSGCPLFLIGDQKQAIYSFRGADIFAYWKARKDIKEEKCFTLTLNWRSAPGLLTALNTIFARAVKPFVYDMISYHPVRAGKSDSEMAEFAEGKGCPFQIWFKLHEGDGEALNAGMANDAFSSAVSYEIARLLNHGQKGRATPDRKAVVPGDIAVIVRTHRQAGYIQDALRRLSIPCVMQSDVSIFSTPEARQVSILMSSIADSGNEGRVKAALVTDILGRSGTDIACLLDDENAWEECLSSFRNYHQLWLDRGFMAMSRLLLSKEGVRGRLLRHSDGERRLTNLLHCFEIIHKKEKEQGIGIEGLTTWFSEKISREDNEEEYQIRLETDEKAVRILTVHASKGLEYPIVFCPFMWGGLRDSDKVVTFHDGFDMVKDFGSLDYERHKVSAQKEALGENLRLLYVALTRAKYRCYLFWGKIADRRKKIRPETSALSYLFYTGEETRKTDDLISKLSEEISGLSETKMLEKLRVLEAESEGSISVVRAPEAGSGIHFRLPDEEVGPPSCRKFSGRIKSDWRVASFTSFSAYEFRSKETPDCDETILMKDVPLSVLPEVSSGKTIFSFPKGAQSGIFFHEIFESLDFTDSSDDSISLVVEKLLAKYRYEKDWLLHVCLMVKNVISLPILESEFTLSSLRPGSWISEFEFFFPLKFITSDILNSYFRKWKAIYRSADLTGASSSLGFRSAEGMVRGFIDMVFEHEGRFYLIDWKSNHLGYRIEDYGHESIKRVIEENLYTLQYMIYAVALNRYLSLRIKDYDYTRHFGGVLYVFLRGAGNAAGREFGIFRDIPPADMIRELTGVLIRAEEDKDDSVF